MTYHRIFNKNSPTGATSGTGTAYPSVAPQLTTCWIFSFLCSVLSIIV